MTYRDLFLDIRNSLRAAGNEAPEFQARELARFAAGKTNEEFIRDLGVIAPESTAKAARAFCERRLRGEPLAYILGEWDFYGINLKITPDVLIPRSDTEVLADWTANVVRGEVGEDFRFLDLCTGSGCIGLSLANAFPKSRGVLLDISPEAVALAAENAKRLKLSNRVLALSGDVCTPAEKKLGLFDVVVSNPPYITREEMAELDRSVRDFEPCGALFGGNDGLHFYRAILENWLCLMKPGGFIAFECGWRQAMDLGRMMKAAGLEKIKIVEDTAGIQRVVSAFAPENINKSEGINHEC